MRICVNYSTVYTVAGSERVKGLTPAYLVALFAPRVQQFLVGQLSDLVVPGHKMDWGLRAFAVAGPSCWSRLPVELRNMSIGPETFT